jgi:tetratricopeptide (TPR) repeat protein
MGRVEKTVLKESELTAQQWFEQGFGSNDPDEKLRCFSQAIRLKPDFPEAYNNRGLARVGKGDLDGALQDYTEAIRLKPGYARVYNNRGLARADKGDLDGALQDYNEAIHHQPDHADAYYNRARIWQKKATYKAAIADFQKYLDAGGGLRNSNAVAVEQIIRELGEKT